MNRARSFFVTEQSYAKCALRLSPEYALFCVVVYIAGMKLFGYPPANAFIRHASAGLFSCQLLIGACCGQGSLSYLQKASIYAGTTFDQGIRNRDLDLLVNSYNAYFNQLGILKTPLQQVRGGTGFYAGISAQLFMLEVGTDYSKSSFRTEAASFNESGKRVWDFTYQTQSLNFIMWMNRFRKAGESSNERDGQSVEFGIPMSIVSNQRVSLRSGYQYADGYISYGYDRPFNGIYHFSYGNDLAAGLRVLIGTRRYRLMAEWMAVGLRNRKDPKYGIGLAALDHLGSVTQVGAPQYLPDDFKDVGTAMQWTGITAQNKHAAVTANFRGNRFRLGLLIDLL
jgi:hypothetical protein